MEKPTLLVGEPMGLLISQQEGPFEAVDGFFITTCGAEFNVAIGMQRIGHPVGYYTKLGNDPFGKRIVNMMNSENISTELIEFVDDKFTGFMLKSKVSQGDPAIFYFRKNSAASTLCVSDIEKLDFSKYGAIHMTGITPALSATTMEATEALRKRARDSGMLFSFDPNLRVQLWPDKQIMCDYINSMASKSDIFMPGINEAKILAGTDVPEEVAEFYLKSGSKLVLIKLGARGAYYASANECGYVDGFHVAKVVDTVGAGDGFTAGFLTAYHEGLSIEESVRRANAIGAIQVMSLGDNDGLPTRREMLDFMDGKPDWRIDHES